MVYWNLFLSFLQIGLFSIGGGYAALPLIQDQVVNIHGWLTLSEFTDVISIAEMTPGPVAINSATFVCIQIAGIPGAVIATIGCILPSCVIVLLLARLYQKYHSLSLMQGALSGLRPAVVSMIASAGLTILLLALFGVGEIRLSTLNLQNLGILLAGLIVSLAFDPNPILIIGGAGVVGVFFYIRSTLSGAWLVALDALGVALALGCIALLIVSRRRRQNVQQKDAE